jgi:hypothetical protein
MERQSIYDDISLLSITKAAKVMRVGKSRIYDFISTNKIKIIDLNGAIRIPYFEIRRCLENLSEYTPCYQNLSETNSTRKKIITNPKNIMESIKKSRGKNE